MDDIYSFYDNLRISLAKRLRTLQEKAGDGIKDTFEYGKIVGEIRATKELITTLEKLYKSSQGGYDLEVEPDSEDSLNVDLRKP